MSRLVVLGRDGVINVDPGHVIRDPDTWQPVPGSLEAIARLTQAGFRVAVATNQPGLASGELTLDALNAIHRKLHDSLDRLGGQLAAIACCPHAPDAGCECRKPAPGMYRQLAERLGVATTDLVVIGHGATDAAAAAVMGARCLEIATPLGETAEQAFDDLAHAAGALLVED